MNVHFLNDNLAPMRTKRPLGLILSEGSFVSSEEINRALDVQAETGELLGEILVKLGSISHVELASCLAIQRDLSTYEGALKAAAANPWSLSEMLMRIGRMDAGALDKVADEQRRTSERLGLILHKYGYISADELKAVVELNKAQSSFEETWSPEARRRLNEILLDYNYITAKNLQAAVSEHEATGKSLERIFIDNGFVTQGHYDHAVELLKKLFLAAMVAFFALSAVPGADVSHAAEIRSRSAKVAVSAYVMPYVKVNTVSQPNEIKISHSDILRGHIEVPQATILQIRSNNRSGYMLTFTNLIQPFIEAEATFGNGSIMRIANESVTMHYKSQEAGSGNNSTVSITYRFILSKDARPGTYVWPLAISVSM